MMTVGSCFAGIGGIDLGLETTGQFRTVWYSEVKASANRVMADRWPDAQPVGDITKLPATPPAAVDVVAGGPPCQGVSKGNAWGRHGLADARSALFHTYADLIDVVRPRWVVMEQVTGLFTSKDDYATVVDTFRKLGYDISQLVVNSLRYVPQTRERLIIVGNREPGAAALALLPLTKDGGVDPREGRPQRRQPAGPAPGGAVGGIYRKSRRPQTNLDGESWVVADYANTLTLNDTGTSRATVIVVDAKGLPRILTPEEWEACHGFPTGWTAPAGSDVERWKCLGNAVSPAVAVRIGEGIAAVEGLEILAPWKPSARNAVTTSPPKTQSSALNAEKSSTAGNLRVLSAAKTCPNQDTLFAADANFF